MAYQERNSGQHIDDIINRTNCSIHDASLGTPCFSIRYGNGKREEGPGICGPRVKKAGFTGTIHPSSLSRSVTKQQPSPRR